MDASDRLIASDEIRGLMARYVRHADHGEWDELAALFVPDGIFTPRDTDGVILAEMNGREEIARTIRESVGRGQAIHHLFSYEVEVVSQTLARGIFAMEDWVVRPDDDVVEEPVAPDVPRFRELRGYGHYRGTYRRIDRDWFIESLDQTRLRLDVIV